MSDGSHVTVKACNGDDAMRTALSTSDAPPQDTEPPSNHGESIKPMPAEGHSKKHLTSTSQDWQDHQNKEQIAGA